MTSVSSPQALVAQTAVPAAGRDPQPRAGASFVSAAFRETLEALDEAGGHDVSRCSDATGAVSRPADGDHPARADPSGTGANGEETSPGPEADIVYPEGAPAPSATRDPDMSEAIAGTVATEADDTARKTGSGKGTDQDAASDDAYAKHAVETAVDAICAAPLSAEAPASAPGIANQAEIPREPAETATILKSASSDERGDPDVQGLPAARPLLQSGWNRGASPAQADGRFVSSGTGRSAPLGKEREAPPGPAALPTRHREHANLPAMAMAAEEAQAADPSADVHRSAETDSDVQRSFDGTSEAPRRGSARGAEAYHGFVPTTQGSRTGDSPVPVPQQSAEPGKTGGEAGSSPGDVGGDRTRAGADGAPPGAIRRDAVRWDRGTAVGDTSKDRVAASAEESGPMILSRGMWIAPRREDGRPQGQNPVPRDAALPPSGANPFPQSAPAAGQVDGPGSPTVARPAESVAIPVAGAADKPLDDSVLTALLDPASGGRGAKREETSRDGAVAGGNAGVPPLAGQTAPPVTVQADVSSGRPRRGTGSSNEERGEPFPAAGPWGAPNATGLNARPKADEGKGDWTVSRGPALLDADMGSPGPAMGRIEFAGPGPGTPAPGPQDRNADLARSALRPVVEVLHRGPGGPVEVALQPEELGRVRVTFSPVDGGLQVALSADRPETLDLMRRHVDVLLQDLRQAGYHKLTLDLSGSAGRGADGFAQGPGYGSGPGHRDGRARVVGTDAAQDWPDGIAGPERTLRRDGGLDIRL